MISTITDDDADIHTPIRIYTYEMDCCCHFISFHLISVTTTNNTNTNKKKNSVVFRRTDNDEEWLMSVVRL
jgi:hypothetical protein